MPVSNVSPIDRTNVPILIAQFLPVEICVYYQVVPIAKDGDQLTLGMVDPEDVAALDYVGKMLAYSRLKIEPHPLTASEQQALIAYYFSNPPDSAQVKAAQAQARAQPQTIVAPLAETENATRISQPPAPGPNQSHQADHAADISRHSSQPISTRELRRTLHPQSTRQLKKTPPLAPLPSQATIQAKWDPNHSDNGQPPAASPPQPPIPTLKEESEATVQQLLNSMLRRALDENAEQIYIDVQANGTCRVRYRQQGIVRDLFRQLSDGIRARLLASLKKMINMDPEVIGEPQIADVERTFRKEPLILQLKIIPQEDAKESAILTILRGESLHRYHQSQHNQRVMELTESTQIAQESLQMLHESLLNTIERVKQHRGIPNQDWFALKDYLDALRAQAQLIEVAQQDWEQILKEDPMGER